MLQLPANRTGRVLDGNRHCHGDGDFPSFFRQRGFSMDTPLQAYVQDHLAGAKFGIRLIDRISRQHPRTPLGDFTAELSEEVLGDLKQLQKVASVIEARPLPILKELTAVLFEKLSQIKLGKERSSGAGTLLSLETLYLGIRGKASLWRALSIAKVMNPQLRPFHFVELESKAISQYQAVEWWRQRWAFSVLTASAS